MMNNMSDRDAAEAPESGDVTRVLASVSEGDEAARVRLIELLYEELRRLAGGLMRRERTEHTLQPTALVNEACLKLLGAPQSNWASRAEFFGSAAEVMRRVLVDHARRKLAAKRGGGQAAASLDAGAIARLDDANQVLGVDEALAQLAATDSRKAEIVKLRFFAGLEIDEIAAVLDVAPITVKRDWRYARAWLGNRLNEKT
jgi:RNA polymerase sigma factor (TIGR02999 family)